jgi:hypothetical protein
MSRAKLGKLLDEGERATVHGPPAQAADLLAHALDVALDAGDQAGGARARWLLGVAAHQALKKKNPPTRPRRFGDSVVGL